MRLLIPISVAALLLSGCMTLHTAAKKGNVKAIDRLIEDGEDLNRIDEEGMSPLVYAIMFNQKESFNALLDAGADINLQDPSSGNTPLHEAVMAGNRYFVSQLLAKEANPKIQNHHGLDAIMIAKKKDNPALVALFKPENEEPEALRESIAVSDNSAKTVETLAQEEVKYEEPKPLVIEQRNQEQAKTALIPNDASEVLQKMIEHRETLGIRKYLDEYPESISLIKEVHQQVRYVGPSGMRIIDILDIKRNKKMADAQIIQHIHACAKPYKKFSQEEKKILAKYGISTALINAMETVSK